MKKVLCFLVSVAMIAVFCSCGAAMSNEEDYLKAPEIIFTTAAEDNGYGERYMYVDGTAGKVFVEKDMEICEIQTEDGKIAMLRVPIITSPKEWKNLKEGELVRIKFQYLGYSDVLDEASGALVSVEKLG